MKEKIQKLWIRLAIALVAANIIFINCTKKDGDKPQTLLFNYSKSLEFQKKSASTFSTGTDTDPIDQDNASWNETRKSFGKIITENNSEFSGEVRLNLTPLNYPGKGEKGFDIDLIYTANHWQEVDVDFDDINDPNYWNYQFNSYVVGSSWRIYPLGKAKFGNLSTTGADNQSTIISSCIATSYLDSKGNDEEFLLTNCISNNESGLITINGYGKSVNGWKVYSYSEYPEPENGGTISWYERKTIFTDTEGGEYHCEIYLENNDNDTNIHESDSVSESICTKYIDRKGNQISLELETKIFEKDDQKVSLTRPKNVIDSAGRIIQFEYNSEERISKIYLDTNQNNELDEEEEFVQIFYEKLGTHVNKWIDPEGYLHSWSVDIIEIDKINLNLNDIPIVDFNYNLDNIVVESGRYYLKEYSENYFTDGNSDLTSRIQYSYQIKGMPTYDYSRLLQKVVLSETRKSGKKSIDEMATGSGWRREYTFTETTNTFTVKTTDPNGDIKTNIFDSSYGGEGSLWKFGISKSSSGNVSNLESVSVQNIWKSGECMSKEYILSDSVTISDNRCFPQLSSSNRIINRSGKVYKKEVSGCDETNFCKQTFESSSEGLKLTLLERWKNESMNISGNRISCRSVIYNSEAPNKCADGEGVGSIETYDYNEDGTLKIKNKNTIPVEYYSYYPDGRVETITDSVGIITQLTYDDYSFENGIYVSQVTKNVLSENGNGSKKSETQTFDETGKLFKSRDNISPSPSSFEITRDSWGRETYVNYPNGDQRGYGKPDKVTHYHFDQPTPYLHTGISNGELLETGEGETQADGVRWKTQYLNSFGEVIQVTDAKGS